MPKERRNNATKLMSIGIFACPERLGILHWLHSRFAVEVPEIRIYGNSMKWCWVPVKQLTGKLKLRRYPSFLLIFWYVSPREAYANQWLTTNALFQGLLTLILFTAHFIVRTLCPYGIISLPFVTASRIRSKGRTDKGPVERSRMHCYNTCVSRYS